VLSLPAGGSTAGFPKAVLHQKLDDGQSPKQENHVTEGFLLSSNYEHLH